MDSPLNGTLADIPPTPTIHLRAEETDDACARLLGFEHCRQYMAFPFRREGGHLLVAVREVRPDELAAMADITGYFIAPFIAGDEDIRFHIDKVFRKEHLDALAMQFVDERGKVEVADVSPEVAAAPAVRLINSLIETGVLHHASDIHVEPFGSELRARYRVDGQLITYSRVDISLLPNVISRLKIMGGMDIAEKRKPQDGHLTIESENEKIELRLSTLPTVAGEKIAIRLLYGNMTQLKKDELGFYPEDLEKLTSLFNQPYGAVFMTGPTGSGKSTTLNVFLEEMNRETRNIVTVEDPVENPIRGVSHVNVERAVGFDFAGALKHILRQDPDIIMIGEMRDEETARIAMQAAITGHVVLSTLHTNDAAGVVERLTDMGIEPYLVAAALNGVISQRLVRRICRDCAAPSHLTHIQAAVLNLEIDTPVFTGRGCRLCNNTGYRSRFAVYEYFTVDERTRRRISTQPELFAESVRKKRGLRKSAIRALVEGNTTVDEVIQALSRENLAQA